MRIPPRDNTPLRDGVIPLRERVSLAQEWEQFARDTIPAQAGPQQRIEMRRCFYGGAAGMFALVTGGLDADHEPTDLDVAYLDSISRELADFAVDVAKNRA